MTFYSPIAQYGAEKECFELVFRYCEHCKGSVTFENDAAEYGGHSVRSQQIFTTLEAQVAHAQHANPFGRFPSVGPSYFVDRTRCSSRGMGGTEGESYAKLRSAPSLRACKLPVHTLRSPEAFQEGHSRSSSPMGKLRPLSYQTTLYAFSRSSPAHASRNTMRPPCSASCTAHGRNCVMKY